MGKIGLSFELLFILISHDALATYEFPDCKIRIKE